MRSLSSSSRYLLVAVVLAASLLSHSARSAPQALKAAPIAAWAWLSLVALLGYFACRKWPWSALFVLPFSIVLPAAMLIGESPQSGTLLARAPGHDNPSFLALAIAVILTSEFVGLLQGGFRIAFFPPWGASGQHKNGPASKQ